MRSLKILGVVVAATLALSTVSVATAFATYDQALIGEPATISGGAATFNVLTTVSGQVKCEVATFSGHGIGAMAEPTTGTTTYAEETIHPVYGNCKAFGLNAVWETSGCNFVLTTATTTTRSVTGFDAHAAFHIECEPGHKLVINAGAGGCIVEIGEQTPSGVVDFKNEANGTVQYQWTIEGIAYHQEGSKCKGGAENRSDGTLTGSANALGKDKNGVVVAISVT